MLQNTRAVFFLEQKKEGCTTQNLRGGCSNKLVLPESKYSEILTSRYPFSGPHSHVCRIRHGGGFLAKCTEAINETMPHIHVCILCILLPSVLRVGLCPTLALFSLLRKKAFLASFCLRCKTTALSSAHETKPSEGRVHCH